MKGSSAAPALMVSPPLIENYCGATCDVADHTRPSDQLPTHDFEHGLTTLQGVIHFLADTRRNLAEQSTEDDDIDAVNQFEAERHRVCQLLRVISISSWVYDPRPTYSTPNGAQLVSLGFAPVDAHGVGVVDSWLVPPRRCRVATLTHRHICMAPPQRTECSKRCDSAASKLSDGHETEQGVFAAPRGGNATSRPRKRRSPALCHGFAFSCCRSHSRNWPNGRSKDGASFIASIHRCVSGASPCPVGSQPLR